jgi:proteasome accessory factor C
MDSKMSTPIAKTARLLSLVPFLLTHQNIALRELSREFSCTEKEMLDDLNTLWMCGLPGYTPLELIDLSFDSGFVTIRNAEVLQEVRSVTMEELIVLLLGLDLVKSAAQNPQIQESIESLRLKIQRISGDVVLAKPVISHEMVHLINLALKQRSELLFTYLSSSNDEPTKRVIHPTDLRSEGTLLYLDGYCIDARAFRTFRIDRISDLRIGGIHESLESPKHGAEESKVEKIQGQAQIHNNLRRNSERLGIDLESARGAIEATLGFSFFSEEWLVRSALSSAGDLEISSPQSSRSQILTRSRALLTAYERGELPL